MSYSNGSGYDVNSEQKYPEDLSKEEVIDETISHLRGIRSRMTAILTIMIAIILYFAKDFFLPIILGVLMALTLSPIVRALTRLGVPNALGSILVVIGLSSSITGVGYVMSGPVTSWINDAPEIGQTLEYKLRSFSRTVKDVQEATKKVDELAETGGDQDVQKVSIETPGLLDSAVSTVATIAASAAVALVLAFFLLASNEMFYRKLIASFPRFEDKKKALGAVYDIERKVSRYLLTITVINALLGIAIGCALYAIGMDDAWIWGVFAFLLNFLPYVGMIVGASLVTVFAIVQFDTLSYAMLAPLAYLFFNALEGQFITPTTVGRRLELNTVAVFLTVVFWGWLWGIPGALMAVPFLVLVKVVCDNVEGLDTLNRFLGSDDTPADLDRDVDHQAAQT